MPLPHPPRGGTRWRIVADSDIAVDVDAGLIQAMKKRKLIKVKEHKGNMNLAEVNRNHAEYRAFDPWDVDAVNAARRAGRPRASKPKKAKKPKKPQPSSGSSTCGLCVCVWWGWGVGPSPFLAQPCTYAMLRVCRGEVGAADCDPATEAGVADGTAVR